MLIPRTCKEEGGKLGLRLCFWTLIPSRSYLPPEHEEGEIYLPLEVRIDTKIQQAGPHPQRPPPLSGGIFMAKNDTCMLHAPAKKKVASSASSWASVRCRPVAGSFRASKWPPREDGGGLQQRSLAVMRSCSSCSRCRSRCSCPMACTI